MVKLLFVLTSLALSVPLNNQVPLTQGELRLISISETSSSWLNEEQIFTLVRNKVKFIDVTDGDLNKNSLLPLTTFKLPLKPTQQEKIKPLIEKISVPRLESFLTTFSSFHTRYFKSAAGKESGQWLFDSVKEIADSADIEKVIVSVRQFEHSWGQHSVIARIERLKGVEDEIAAGIVIVGAHQDSVNQWNPWFGRSPGADDDGSGTTTTIETFRILVESGYVPVKALEFHWYSAEEGGLLGSQKVAAHYFENGAQVAGMFHVDMTGFAPKNKKLVIGVSNDFVDKDLSDFLKKVTEVYSDIPWADTKCGYGCSDHASWNKLGYPAVFTFESEFKDHSPYIHTSDDTVAHIDFDHVASFVRVVLGWAVEMTSKY